MSRKTPQKDAAEAMPASTRRTATAKREAAILALLSHPTLVDAAKAAGVSEDTLRRWLKEPAFRSRYDEARRCVYDQGIGYVHTLASKAARTLETVMDDPEASAAARVTAAKTVLDLAVRDAQVGEILSEMMERLEAVEKRREEDEG